MYEATTTNETISSASRQRVDDDKARVNTSWRDENVDIGTFRGYGCDKSGAASGETKSVLFESHPGPPLGHKNNNQANQTLPVAARRKTDATNSNTIDVFREKSGGVFSNIKTIKSRTQPPNKMKLRAQSASSISANRRPDFPMKIKSASTSRFQQRVWATCQTQETLGGKGPGLAPTLSDALGRLRQQSARRRKERLSPPERHGFSRRARSAGPAFGRSTPEDTMRSSPVNGCTHGSTDSRSKARLRFRQAVRLVRVVVKFMRAMMKLSSGLTSRTAAEMQWYTLNSSMEAKKLAFNPSLYAKNRVYAKVPKWAINTLQQDPDNRPETDCRRLHALLRGLKAFDKFTEKIQISMCRSFSYQCFESQRVILREGHVGQNFYIVYSGSVFVNVNDVSPEGTSFVKTEVVLSKGDSFGELALLQDILRTATVTCRETCELLVVDKQMFSKICPKIFDMELEEKLRFIRNLPLFNPKYWTQDKLHSMCFEGQIQEYKTNKVIVSDSRQDEWMYVCMEGRCRIIKCLALGAEAEEQSNKKKKRQTSLVSEDRLLTAEFLQADNARRHSEDGETLEEQAEQKKAPPGRLQRRGSIIHHHRTKKQLLKSLGLTYLGKEKDDTEDAIQREKEMITATEERTTREHRQKSLQGVLTLTQFMTSRLKEGGKNSIVFLHIGVLEPGEVFDLSEALKRDNNNGGMSSLVLVSSGAKTMRLKKQTFQKCMTPEALMHAKQIAVKHLYPSSSVLAKSYREKCQWDSYKQKVISEVVHPFLTTARQREVAQYLSQVDQVKRRQESRVMSSLKRSKDQKDPEKTYLEQKEFALDEPDPDLHDGFVSKSLRDADKSGCLQLPSAFPRDGIGAGRKSVYIPTGQLQERQKSAELRDAAGGLKTELATVESITNELRVVWPQDVCS